MKSRNNRHTDKELLIATGLTVTEAKKEIKQHERDRRSTSPRCYHCRRQEGERSLVLDELNEKAFSHEVTLDQVIRQVGNTTLIYNLCFECAVLLGLHEDQQKDVMEIPKPSTN